MRELQKHLIMIVPVVLLLLLQQKNTCSTYKATCMYRMKEHIATHAPHGLSTAPSLTGVELPTLHVYKSYTLIPRKLCDSPL